MNEKDRDIAAYIAKILGPNPRQMPLSEDPKKTAEVDKHSHDTNGVPHFGTRDQADNSAARIEGYAVDKSDVVNVRIGSGQKIKMRIPEEPVPGANKVPPAKPPYSV